MKKFFKILGNIVFVLIMIFIVVGIVGNLSGKSDKLYNIVRYRTYVIVSPSMKPTIDAGDLIFIKKVDINNLKKGDIVSFKNDDIIATHRIVDIDDKKVVTKGDNNNIEDYPTDKSDIIGKFIFAIPKIGYVISYAMSPVGMVTIALVITFIFIYDFIFREKKSKSN